jgi:hypothetical protein
MEWKDALQVAQSALRMGFSVTTPERRMVWWPMVTFGDGSRKIAGIGR